MGEKMFRLDYISCILTVVAAVLIGRKLWYGWIVALANSLLICLIGLRTAQFGFIPANLFCIALYSYNLRTWCSSNKLLPRHPETAQNIANVDTPGHNALAIEFVAETNPAIGGMGTEKSRTAETAVPGNPLDGQVSLEGGNYVSMDRERLKMSEAQLHFCVYE